MPVLTFARYILEMSLLDYNFNVETSESLLAAAALVLALKIKGIKGWTETLKVRVT
jgi:cyclin B